MRPALLWTKGLIQFLIFLFSNAHAPPGTISFSNPLLKIDVWISLASVMMYGGTARAEHMERSHCRRSSEESPLNRAEHRRSFSSRADMPKAYPIAEEDGQCDE